MSARTNGESAVRRRRVDVNQLVRLGVPVEDMNLTAAHFDVGAEGSVPAQTGRTRLGLLLVLLSRDLSLIALVALAPDLSRSLGVASVGIGLVALLQLAAGPAMTLVGAGRREVDIRRRLPLVAGAMAVLLALHGAVSSLGLLFLLSLVHGLVAGAGEAAAVGSLVAARPTRAQNTVSFAVARVAGIATSLLLVGLVAGPLGSTWRGAFLVLALVPLAGATLLALAPVVLGDEAAAEGEQLGVFERLRRIGLIPSAKRALGGAGLLGVLGSTYVVFGLGTLSRSTGLDFAATSMVLGASMLVGVGAALALLLSRLSGEQPTTGALLSGTRGLLLTSSLLLLLSPFLAGSLLVALPLVAGGALLGFSGAAVLLCLVTVVPPDSRTVAHAMATVSAGPAGSILALLVISGIDRRFSPGVALAMAGVAGLLLARLVKALAQSTDGDGLRTLASSKDEHQLRLRREAGAHIPMLTCQGIDFSYGQLQVLFDVDFTVDEGEMVALLGTNGAGKSTLLRVISGLGLPSSGRVHFDGSDITYLDPERRTERGLTQIPGGKAVFGNMSVAENLRVFGHALGRSPKALDEGIEATFAAFPRLYERRNQFASTLSGGEQQMLALGKALIIKPRLLCIDELSLGLAPIIVGQLLEMVRKINEGGTAVVLVEQSVNVALSLVDHAYFMEKGEIRFDGKASELLHRRDLLRSVFLEGVAEGAG